MVDQTGNVLIRKPATAGMENRKGVSLQAHVYMVPQKTPDKDHNCLTDPIEAYVQGEWVKADWTTSGADGGGGVTNRNSHYCLLRFYCRDDGLIISKDLFETFVAYSPT